MSDNIDRSAVDQLIIGTGEGDLAAFEQLYVRFRKPVYLFSLTICRDARLAEDILQDTFVAVWSGARHYQSQGYGQTWILAIAKNIALDYIKRRKPEILWDPALANPFNPDGGDLENEEEAIGNIYVSTLLSRLKQSERDLIVLHLIVGLRLSEIAKQSSIPLGTVYWRYNSAIRKLRQFYNERT